MSNSELPDWIKKHLDEYAKAPAKGHLWDATAAGGRADTPTLLLTTIGRKSGKSITLPLIYGADGDTQVIVASKGGAPEHPAWYLNLQADPHVEVQVIDKKFHATARVATGTERQRLWDKLVEVYPPYTDYQKKTTREIPVVVLERVT
jgi:deazaflavin-dependent oxidoreductase (nitroreductase family)